MQPSQINENNFNITDSNIQWEICDATSMPGIKKNASTKKKELMQINCRNCKPNPTVTVAEIILINVQQNNKENLF